jgi:hypothetical protein
MKKNTMKAWAVLGYQDKKPMPFGDLAKNFRGALSVFEKRADAMRMATLSGKDPRQTWEVRKCEIIISQN